MKKLRKISEKIMPTLLVRKISDIQDCYLERGAGGIRAQKLLIKLEKGSKWLCCEVKVNIRR